MVTRELPTTKKDFQFVAMLDNTIRMQLIGEYLYPIDSWSRDTLFEETNHDRFKKDMLDLISPRLVKRGFKLAISNYN